MSYIRGSRILQLSPRAPPTDKRVHVGRCQLPRSGSRATKKPHVSHVRQKRDFWIHLPRCRHEAAAFRNRGRKRLRKRSVASPSGGVCRGPSLRFGASPSGRRAQATRLSARPRRPSRQRRKLVGSMKGSRLRIWGADVRIVPGAPFSMNDHKTLECSRC